MGTALSTNGLTKHYGGTRAVDGLTFNVPEGSIFGFLGPNGAGKTTTFSLLCGFARATRGKATILGEPLSRLDLVRHRMSALPQDARFHPARKIRDGLRFLAELGGMERSDAKKEADRVLEAVGLQDARSVKGRALSHGMAKRFGIAQAFLGKPELVLLDEPTEGLDPRTAHKVRELIASLAHKSTVLVSSHNLSEVEDLCDHAAIIDKGKLVRQGTLAELTDADEVLIVSLGTGSPDPTKVLSAMGEVVTVELSPTRDKVRLTLKPGEDTPVEAAITAVLKTIIESGATIGDLHRGRSLEERFLELT
ncbi:MAG: ABC transporter ATP-binding protein [Deltaproteobacteria bacterium]|nr:ABC transporter ATP-binding protein [Deltaproteobacteria bacterium]